MKQIALAFPMGVSHLERVAYGIRRYNKEHGNWLLVTNPERHNLELAQLRNWQGDGIIGFINSPEEAQIIQKLDIPAINLSGALAESPIPRVRVDYYKMGSLGAEHLIARGFDDLAYYGLENVWYAEEIGRGFCDKAAEYDKNVHRYDAKSSLSGSWSGVDKQLLSWLSELPKPSGLMAAHDPRALEVLQACLQLEIRVPEDLALLGVNNDTITCELAQPTLSSIPRDGERTGYEAAVLLGKLLNGQVTPGELKKDIVIDPLSPIDRGSTAYLALKDPDLLQAVNYIRKNIDKQINVNSICQYTSKSRRWLEYTFKKEMSLSPLEFLTKVRVSKAKELLEENSSFKLSAVAHMSGFSSTDQMNKAFRKAYGKTARDFRKL
jgi:LacI family transcriptional regulator